MKFITFLSVAFWACVSGADPVLSPREEALRTTIPCVYTNASGATLSYRQNRVEAGAGEKFPVVLFFHGAGERGVDNKAQLVHGVGPILRYAKKRKMPLLLLAPQCPNGQQWVDTPWSILEHPLKPNPSASMALVMSLLEAKLAEFPNADRTRVYVTGLSMGGYGTWDILSRKPQIFAAAIPVCGGGDFSCAPRFAKVPVWVFHGSADGCVPVKNSRNMVSALWACDGNVRYREYPEAGHGVWEPTYSDDTVLDWFFRQKK